MAETATPAEMNGVEAKLEKNSVPSSPSVIFKKITFSDKSCIELGPDDVVVLVGPNNAGKSVAIKELEQHIVGATDPIVVKSAEICKSGSQNEFEKFFDEYVTVTPHKNYRSYRAYGLSVDTGGDLKKGWPDNLSSIRGLFCTKLLTENRIKDSNPIDSIDQLEEAPSHPIHMMLDDDTEEKISGYFREAFGQDLILPRSAGQMLRLRAGKRLILKMNEDRVSTQYLKRLRNVSWQLEKQGDGMRSFASVILHILAPVTQSVLLLDEPEAFLHPPQARLLGKLIAENKRLGSQLFVATHSPDVLHGLMEVAPDNLRVLRMQREGDVNRMKELDKSLVKEISSDPLMKYSSVMSGVFHKRVIICEGDSDCMFYSSILDLPEVHGEQQPDVLFVHGGSKDRMASLAGALVALDVPVDVIADIDILNDTSKFCRIIETLGGETSQLRHLAKVIKKTVESRKRWLDSGEVSKEILRILGDAPADGVFPRELRSQIDAVFRKASPWDAVKRSGKSDIPSGQPTRQYEELESACNEIGLWIVPVGELEGFCKTIDGHGPTWVQSVIEKRMLNQPKLTSAREFVRAIWTSR